MWILVTNVKNDEAEEQKTDIQSLECFIDIHSYLKKLKSTKIVKITNRKDL